MFFLFNAIPATRLAILKPVSVVLVSFPDGKSEETAFLFLSVSSITTEGVADSTYLQHRGHFIVDLS